MFVVQPKKEMQCLIADKILQTRFLVKQHPILKKDFPGNIIVRGRKDEKCDIGNNQQHRRRKEAAREHPRQQSYE